MGQAPKKTKFKTDLWEIKGIFIGIAFLLVAIITGSIGGVGAGGFW